MKLHVIGSSSKGNGYVLTNGNETLVIEAGCHYRKVKEAINFNVASIQAVLVSHSHSDHAAYVREYTNEGLKVIASPDVAEVYEIPSLQLLIYSSIKPSVLRAGRFQILPFHVVHDVPCYGFLIQHPDCGKIVFITDTHFSPARFKGINHYIIEANYSEAILEQRLRDGKINYAYYERVLRSHMSLETTIKLLKANDLTQTQSITLIHLSDGNSNEQQFQQIIAQETGVPTYVADAGIEVNLSIF